MDEIAAEKQTGKGAMETKKDQETIMETKKNEEAVKRQEDEAGVAKIKAEYRLVDYKPKLETEYVSQTVKDQMDDATAKTEGAEDGAEPPAKRVKLKGRNKKRPKGKRMDASTKMCSALIQERECSYGDRCKFSHDKKKFFENKPADIGPDCYLFETYGKCPYGLSCRFAKAHVTEDLTNKVKDDVVNREKKISNVLKKDLQISLWKRTFDFSKADEVLDKVCPGAYHQRKKTAKKESGGKPETPASSDKSLATSTGTVITEKSENTNENNQSGAKEAGIQNDQKDEVKTDIENGVASSSGKDINKDNISVDLSGDTKVDTVDCLVSAEAGTVPNETAVAMDTLDRGDEGVIRLRPQEKKKIDFTDKLYLAPLTTVGNLPYRRICKRFGADITCGEMAVCTNLLQGQQSEWALLKRHESEDLFGVQLCGAYPDSMTRCAQLITETMNVDFIDINCGCPIDLIFNKGEGSALMGRLTKFEQIVKSMTSVMDVPLTVKVRTGIYSDKSIAHNLMPKLRDWNVALATVHGRSRVQRYTKMADWDYISQCAEQARPMPLFGNGDILSYEDANRRREQTGVSGLMIARGALIKPWIFTEIKEQRHWDISSSERFDLLKDFANFGFDHWGSDHQGVENTRRFLLEWLSFLYRYIPVGILERVPQQINERPPYYMGRDDMETLMASPSCSDWIKISEMLLGPVPEGFNFLPKHKANAYK